MGWRYNLTQSRFSQSLAMKRYKVKNKAQVIKEHGDIKRGKTPHISLTFSPLIIQFCFSPKMRGTTILFSAGLFFMILSLFFLFINYDSIAFFGGFGLNVMYKKLYIKHTLG